MRQVPRGEVRYEPDGRYYHDGMVFSGVAVNRYPSGERSSEVTFRHGLRSGVSRDWYRDGTLAGECCHVQDAMHGSSRSWYPDGTLESEAEYEYGVVLRQREWDGEGVLVLDERTGIGPDEEPRATARRFHGHGRHRPPTVDDGDALRRWRDRESAPAAEDRTVEPDGVERRADGLWYHAGEPVTGTVRSVERDGGRHDSVYRAGLLWGVSRGWYADGTPRAEGGYRQGVRHGASRAWYPDGSPEGEALYEYGILCRQREWAPDGSLIEDFELAPDDPDHALLMAYRELLGGA